MTTYTKRDLSSPIFSDEDKARELPQAAPTTSIISGDV